MQRRKSRRDVRLSTGYSAYSWRWVLSMLSIPSLFNSNNHASRRLFTARGTGKEDMEIERKFLVKRDGAFHKYVTSSSHIAQGYMDVKGATVRIRLRDDKAYLTIKGPSANGISRYEFEREIPLDDAREMLKLCQGGLVEKTRHLVPVGNHTYEVDEFHGANDGLLFCEVELGSEDEEFEKPDWLGPEVTGNRHFYNKGLLTDPYPNWKTQLPEEYR